MAIDANVQFTNRFAATVVNSAVSGASYYLGALWFTTIPAPTAAVFGATAAAVNLITQPLFESVFARQEAIAASKALGWVATTLTNAIAAGFVAKLVTGYAITLGAAFSLFLSAMLASFVVFAVLGLCGCGAILNN